MSVSAVRVGLSVAPATAEVDRIRAVVRMADDVGLDVVGIHDHPYQSRFLDTWSLLATLLAQTSRVSMFTDVANLPLRPPAMMTKPAASLDVLSGGRFDLARCGNVSGGRRPAWRPGPHSGRGDRGAG
jgi:alkanesulfonate monooxygenase SsuD/methylene tetrahydromethanopterin reductase-like flavin-dependent oxidoreductase (luciferase family)